MLNLLKTIIPVILSGFLLWTVSARELMQIVQSGTLRVAVTDTATPPFMRLNRDKEFHGFELDLVKSCAKTMGVKVELVPVGSFNDLVKALEEDKADISLSLLSRTPARLLRVSFTQPYAKPHIALLVNRQEMLRRRKNKTLDSYLRTYDGPLMVRNGSSHLDLAKELFPNAKVTYLNTMDELDSLIQKRKLVAFIDDQISIRVQMQRHPGVHLFYQRVILEDTTDNICIALPPDCPRLQFFLNCFLEQNMNRINSILKPVL